VFVPIGRSLRTGSPAGTAVVTASNRRSARFLGCRFRRLPRLVSVGLLSLLIAACGGGSSLPESDQPVALRADAVPVLIDTDMAADDWLAILYLLKRPDVDVRAITVTGAGEAHCPAGTRNALKLAALAGRPEIPVACGRETPLAGTHAFPEEWRESVDELVGLELPEGAGVVSRESAVELLTRLVRTSTRKIHVLALGPLTNVCEALLAEPSLVDHLEMITIMGGAVRVPGNVGAVSTIENDTAEWNFYVDPSAAGVVLDSGAPVTLVPLDATNDVPVTAEFFDRMHSDRTTAAAAFAYEVLAAHEGDLSSGRFFFWDPLAAAVVGDDGLVTVVETPIVVITEEGPESGRTLESESGASVRVAMSADRARFEKLFLDTLNDRLP